MIKVAVIGAGSMGSNHARIYSELPEVDFVGLVDANPITAETAAKKWNVPGYTNIDDLFNKEKPDAVSITVPTILHEEFASKALILGAHVLVEKPIAATIESAERLIRCAEINNRKLMVGHVVRFNPAMQALKQKLDEGQLGKIFSIVCRRVGPYPTRIQDVGVVIDLAPHDIDVMHYLTGKIPFRVYAEIENRLHTNHEDLSLSLLRFDDGVIGSIEVNWLTPTKIRETLVLGERGLFRVDDLTQDLYFYENSQATGVSWSTLQTLKGVQEGSMIRFAFPKHEPLKAELQAFINSIKNNSDVPISGAEGLASLKIALALISAGKDNQVKSIL